MKLIEVKIKYTDQYIKSVTVLLKDKDIFRAYQSDTTTSSGYYKLPKSKTITQGMIENTIKAGYKVTPEHFFEIK